MAYYRVYANRYKVPPPTRVGLKMKRLKISRFFTTGLKMLIILGVISMILLFTGYFLYRWTLYSPAFIINEITVGGNHFLTQTEILKIAKIDVGQNIYKVALREVIKGMEKDPWIKRAEVSRMLPNKIFIHIEERIPFAFYNSEKLTLVDEDGDFLTPKNSAVYNYPVITDNFLMDLKAEDEKMRCQYAVQILKLLRTIDQKLFDNISEINISDIQNVKLYLKNYGTEVRLGGRHYDQKIVNLKTLLENIEDNKIQSINLEFDNMAYIQKSFKEVP